MTTESKDTLSAIRARRTLKMLSDAPLPVTPADEDFIDTLLTSAYWAPFHYEAHPEHRQSLSSPLPFRCYVLDSQACRDLVEPLSEAGSSAGTICKMLNAADYLIQATWTPHPNQDGSGGDGQLFDPSLVNMEHLAAAGAGIQNLLLSATALGRENYWSSGGVLRQPAVCQWLDIPATEILLGSLFIFPSASAVDADSVTTKESGKRERRGELSDFYRWITTV